MENVQASLIHMAKSCPVKRAERSARDGGKTERAGEDFRKLMEKQQSPEKQTEEAPLEAKTAKSEEEPAAVGSTPEEELRQRMMLAAMSFLEQPPVPQTELKPEPEAEEAPVAVESLEILAEPHLEAQAAPEAKTAENPTEKGELLPEEQHFEAAAKAVETKTAPGEKVIAEKPREEVLKEKLPTEKVELREGADVESPLFHEVKAVPVKVGEAAPTEGKQERPVPQQLYERLDAAIKKGETTLEMELRPKNLGKVKLELHWHKDGSLELSLQAEKAETRALLSRDAGTLRALLGQDSREEVRVEVSQSEESSRPRYDEGQQGREQQSREQREARRDEKNSDEEFLHQLRLGLEVPEVNI